MHTMPRGLAVAIVTGCCLFAAALPPAAGDASTDGELTLELSGSRTQRARVVSLERDQLTIDAGGRQQKIAVAELSTASARKVAALIEARLNALQKAPSPPREGQPWIDLADLCLHHALYADARRCYRRAGLLDDSFVVRTLAGDGVRNADRLEARDLYQRAVDLQGKGKNDDATRALDDLLARFGASSYAPAARRLLEVIAKAPKPDKGKPDQGKPDKGKPDAPRDRWIVAMERALTEIEARRKEGLSEQGEGHASKALKQFETGMEQIDALAGVAARAAKHPKAEVAERARQLIDKELPTLRSRFHLLLAHSYATSNQLRQATFHVNQVLIVEPDNEQALGLRDKITAEAMKRLGNRNK